jgi:hypothetical protein
MHKRQLTTIHTIQLQQYVQDNYNNTLKTTNNKTHKTTTTINKRHLTTIHKRQKQYTQVTIHTRHLKMHVQKLK